MLVSIVAPVFNEEDSLPLFIQRVLAVVSTGSSNYGFEIILVDDGSTDASGKIIEELCASNEFLKGISFTRNFGHQIAIFAGIQAADGDLIVTLDSDLQDPPELIPELLMKHSLGFEVVNAVRLKRNGEALTKRAFAFIFYRLLRKIVQFDFPLDSGDYRLFSKRVRDSLIGSSEGSQYLRGQIAWLGHKSTTVEYIRSPREYGSTSYPFRKSLRLAIDAVVSLSGAPLRMVSIIGLLLTVLFPSMMMITIALLGVSPGDTSQLLATIAIPLSLSLTFIIAGLAVLSAYIGRLMFQVRKLPLYVIDRTYNLTIQRS